MKELILALIESLKEETARYKKLALLAVEQKELLIAGSVDVLPDNVRLEEKEVFALGPLIAQRNDLLAKMAKILGVRSLTLMEAMQKAPAEMVEELKVTVIEMVRSAKLLDEENKSNEKLLDNALSYVNFTLKIIADGGKKKRYSSATTVEENKPAFVNRIV